MKKKLFGNTSGLRKTQLKTIETLYTFNTPAQYILDPKIANLLVKLSHEIKRQIGLLIDRSGKVIYVLLGDAHKIIIPVTSGYMAIPGKLKGLRLIHNNLLHLHSKHICLLLHKFHLNQLIHNHRMK